MPPWAAAACLPAHICMSVLSLSALPCLSRGSSGGSRLETPSRPLS